MKTAILAFLSILSLTGTATAQQVPVIDHLAIDDPTGRLTIFGNFGSDPGTVTVDSVLTPDSLWTSDSIVCFIPDTGEGSCGPVQVSSMGLSNERLLSAWNMHWFYTFDSPYGEEGNEMYLRFRLDLISALQMPPPISDSTDSNTTMRTFSGPGNGNPLTSDTTVRGSQLIGLNLKNRAVDLNFNFRTYDEAIIGLDQRFNVQSGTSYIGPHERIMTDGSAFFIPPDSVLYQSSVAPSDDATESQAFAISVFGGILDATVPSLPFSEQMLLIDALGRVVTNIDISAGQSSISIPVRLPSGAYEAELNGRFCRFAVIR